jgi:protein ImuB
MFACIYTPDFPVQAVLRLEPRLHMFLPAVVLDGSASLLRVIALNPTARLAGLRPGMTKLQAEACDNVLIRNRSLACEESAQSILLHCAADLSPRVESTAPGIVTLDMQGMQQIFASLQIAAEALTRSVADAGLRTHIAIAGDPDTALHVAIGLPGITVIPPGKEAAHLGPLPLTVLSPTEEMMEVMQQWGIRTCAQLATLPQTGLAARFGEAGVQLQRYARGSCRRVLVPYDAEQVFSAKCELEEAIELLPALMMVITELLNTVITRLREYALAAEKVELDLGLEVYCDRDIRSGPASNAPAPVHALKLSIPTPTQDAGFLAKLLELELAAKPPAAPVKKISLRAVPARPRSTQAGLFSVLTPEPEKLEITIARIRDEVGAHRIGSPRLVDSHQPDNFTLTPFNGIPKSAHSSAASAKSWEPRVCVRKFRPPLPAKVNIREGKPWSIAFQNQTWPVLIASGPWRLSGEWWDRANGWLRNGWHLGLASAEGLALFSVFEDAISHAWFVDGRFD